MKKLYLILIFSLLIITACGNSKTKNNKENSINQTTVTTEKSTTQKENNDLETSSINENTSKDDITTTIPTSTTVIEDTTTETTVTESTTTTKPIITTNPTTKVPQTSHTEPVIVTTQQTTTQAIPQTTTAIQTQKYWVDNQTESSSTTSDYKYGIKKITTTTKYYNIYSDGSKELVDTYTTDSYDKTGYNATDAELLSESNSTTTKNMSYYNEVLKLVNQIRADAGVLPLTLDTTLCQAATMRSLEMDYSGIFSHTRPNGESCFSVLDTYSINWGAVGENIAAGQRTPAAVVESWKNSPGHYANMTNSNYTKLGVGMSTLNQDMYGIYWTQLFTG